MAARPLSSLWPARASAVETAEAAKLRRRTAALGLTAIGSVAALFAAELARVWRLGKLPEEHGGDQERNSSRFVRESRRSVSQVRRIVREGFEVSSARNNALLIVEVAFVTTFATTRWITYTIRMRGGLGPIKNVKLGTRHIHHFIPGTVLTLVSGGTSIAASSQRLDRWLAVPFGAGAALILDESALLLELEDVYWSEEGIVSVQIAFIAASVLAALAYAIRLVAQGESSVLETDWQIAARAWEDLQGLSRS
jgi:hypothetical protein